MAALVEPWHSWNHTQSIPASEHREEDKALGTTSPTKETMVPGTNSHHRSRVLVGSSPITGQQSSRSGGADTDHPPPRQLTSTLPPTTQNQLPFPSTFPLPPPPDFSAMLALLPEIPIRRQNKLRKPSRISATPPVLAPLSFIEEPELDLDFEHISHDVQRDSPHPLRQSLTSESLHPQDVPSQEYCEHPQRQTLSVARRLAKRRRPSLAPIPQEGQVVSSSSGAAAAAAVTGNPSAPIAAVSQISSHSSPHRARSDNGHGIRHSVSIKRQSIIRRLSMRTPKPSLESQTTSSCLSSAGPATPISQTSGIWSRWRGVMSEVGHDSTSEDTPVSLPQVRVSSPFSIPTKLDPDDEAPTATIPPVRMELSNSRPSSPTNYNPIDLSHPISDFTLTRPRAKFTLEGNESEAETSTPPSPIFRAKTLYHFTPDSQSAPPSRSQSAYNPLFLAPLSKPEPTAKVSERRWTFAMAMTDEDITDEVLVEELERMRLRKEWSGSVDEMSNIWDPDYVLFGTFGSQELTDSPQEVISFERHFLEHSEHYLRHSNHQKDLSYTPSLPSFPHQHRNNTISHPDSGSTQQWQTARRVLLTCRELVRTERHYLASLNALLASETETAPPPPMLRYVEELVKVSQFYLAQIEGNPSSWGVAAAFLGVEEAFDGAFVGWCGVVGTWFQEDTRDHAGKTEASKPPSSYTKKLSKPSKQKLVDEFHKENEKPEEETKGGGRLRNMSSWRRSITSVTDVATVTSNPKKKEKESAPPPSFSLYGLQSRRNGKAKKPPSIRDLAILPTQRILRYVLLYRDLLAHTPSTSPSRGLIKRAADAALRIAQKCDRAQTNSAFIVDKNKTDAPATLATSVPTDASPTFEEDTDPSASIFKPSSSVTGTS